MPSPKVILVIEDEPSLQELLASILVDAGYDAVCVGSGSKALELVKTILFNLITLDMNLPGMDGNQFLEELATTNAELPVIVVSATPKKLNSHLQVKKVIAKPFDIEDLLNSIEKYIKT